MKKVDLIKTLTSDFGCKAKDIDGKSPAQLEELLKKLKAEKVEVVSEVEKVETEKVEEAEKVEKVEEAEKVEKVEEAEVEKVGEVKKAEEAKSIPEVVAPVVKEREKKVLAKFIDDLPHHFIIDGYYAYKQGETAMLSQSVYAILKKDKKVA